MEACQWPPGAMAEAREFLDRVQAIAYPRVIKSIPPHGPSQYCDVFSEPAEVSSRDLLNRDRRSLLARD